MNTVAFPACCAMNLHVNFGNTSAAINSTPYSKEEADKFLKSITSNKGADMIVVNSEQRKVLGSVFKDNGYRCISKFHYKGHGNDIFIYLKKNKTHQYGY